MNKIRFSYHDNSKRKVNMRCSNYLLPCEKKLNFLENTPSDIVIPYLYNIKDMLSNFKTFSQTVFNIQRNMFKIPARTFKENKPKIEVLITKFIILEARKIFGIINEMEAISFSSDEAKFLCRNIMEDWSETRKIVNLVSRSTELFFVKNKAERDFIIPTDDRIPFEINLLKKRLKNQSDSFSNKFLCLEIDLLCSLEKYYIQYYRCHYFENLLKYTSDYLSEVDVVMENERSEVIKEIITNLNNLKESLKDINLIQNQIQKMNLVRQKYKKINEDLPINILNILIVEKHNELIKIKNFIFSVNDLLHENIKADNFRINEYKSCIIILLKFFEKACKIFYKNLNEIKDGCNLTNYQKKLIKAQNEAVNKCWECIRGMYKSINPENNAALGEITTFDAEETPKRKTLTESLNYLIRNVRQSNGRGVSFEIEMIEKFDEFYASFWLVDDFVNLLHNTLSFAGYTNESWLHPSKQDLIKIDFAFKLIKSFQKLKKILEKEYYLTNAKEILQKLEINSTVAVSNIIQ